MLVRNIIVVLLIKSSSVVLRLGCDSINSVGIIIIMMGISI